MIEQEFIAHIVYFVCGVISVWELSNDYFNKAILDNKPTGFDKFTNTNLFGDTMKKYEDSIEKKRF